MSTVCFDHNVLKKLLTSFLNFLVMHGHRSDRPITTFFKDSLVKCWFGLSYLLMSAWYLSLALELFCICWSSDLILEQLRIVKPKNTMFEVICSMTGRLKNTVLPWVPPETVTVTQQNSFALRRSYADWRVANFWNLKSKVVFFKSAKFCQIWLAMV